MSHTPGPWTVWRDYNVLAGTRVVAGTGGAQDSMNSERNHRENCANARLIAAAPDMLAALRRLLATINPGNAEEHTPDCRCVIHEARIAIAKATGAKS